jgi:hypothetical protein
MEFDALEAPKTQFVDVCAENEQEKSTKIMTRTDPCWMTTKKQAAARRAG